MKTYENFITIYIIHYICIQHNLIFDNKIAYLKYVKIKDLLLKYNDVTFLIQKMYHQ